MQDSQLAPAAEAGLVLLDVSLTPIAFDQGAVAILQTSNPAGIQPQPASWIPIEAMNLISSRQPADLSPVKTHLRIGNSQYLCRSYLVESHTGLLTRPIVALYFEKDPSAGDMVNEAAARYHLTEREQQVLIGISSMGLTNKELAVRMNISPNTIKAFLRLIMIKMGVTTRAGMVSKLLRKPLFDTPAVVLENVI